MIISESKGFIFIHNPKCAGTTVRERLMHFETTGNFFWMHAELNHQQVDKAHLPLYILKTHFNEYFNLLERNLVFMFTRNPYARLISAFNETHDDLFKAMSTAEDKKQAQGQYKTALNGFIMSSIRGDRLNGYTPAFRHCVRQRDFAFLGNKCYADLILRLEDWPKCLDKLGVFYPEVRDHLLASEARNTRPLGSSPLEFLSTESIKKINRLYRDDFILFGYEMA